MNSFIKTINAKEKEKSAPTPSKKKVEEDLSTTFKKLCKLQSLVKEELVRKIQCKFYL